MEATTSGLIPDFEFIETFHRRWMSIVEVYTQCALTKQEDKLVALSGLVTRIKSAVFPQALGASQSDPYILGLWHISLSLDLLWITDHVASLSPTIDNIPSWTWASKNRSVSSLARRHEIFKHSGPISTWPSTVSIEPFRYNNEHSLLVLIGALVEIKRTSQGPDNKIKHDGSRAIMTYYFDSGAYKSLAFCFLPFFVNEGFCVGLLVAPMDDRKWQRIGVAWGRNDCGWMTDLPKIVVEIL
ncbi:hypothetical protein IQ06DRAFT_91127 [Phaeosphaeriaceae sp. SRC1lsM3a]|nr:hypothetical protein IQ06DRAFT_91127 [Stagonospora sp. SRC1lsM3a]